MKSGRAGKPGSYLIWMALAALGGSLYLLAWPLVMRLVILPEARGERPGFLVEEYASITPSGQHRRAFHHPVSRLELAEPQTSLRAYALWRVPAPGFYRLDLRCDDYGALRLDGRGLLTLEPVTSALNQGQARVFLDAGPHVLELELCNGPGAGWLELRAGSGAGEPAPLSPDAFSYIDLGNLGSWLKAAALAETAALGLVLTALLGLVGLAVQNTLRRLAAGPQQADGNPSRWRGWPWAAPGQAHGSFLPPWSAGLALALLAAGLAWPTGLEHGFDGLPWSSGAEVLVVAVIAPLLLLWDRGFLRRPLAWCLLACLVLIKLALWIGAPASGWSLRAYESPGALAAGQWEHTYETRWQPVVSGVLRGPLWQGADLPLAWQSRKPISEPERLGAPMILEVEGCARLPAGAGLALVAAGASQGHITVTDEKGRQWDLPLAAGLARVRGEGAGAYPQGKVRLHGVIHYDRRPWQDWSLVPVLADESGGARPLTQGGVLWQGPEGLDLSEARLTALRVLAWAFDGGLVIFLAGWGVWAGGAWWLRGLLNQALLAASLLGLALPWLLRGLGLGSSPALIAGLGLPLALLLWLTARQPGLAGSWGQSLGRVLLLAIGPGLLGYFLLTWWPQAGQATLLSYSDDFGVYQLYAHRMAVEGDWWLRYMQFLHFQPLYPYIVALLHMFFGQSMLAQGLLDVWAALGAACLLPVLALRLGSTPARGLAAALIYLAVELGPDFTWHLGRGLQEHTAMLLLLLTAYAVTAPAGTAWSWSGGLWALLTYLLRQDYAGALAGMGLLGAWLRQAAADTGWRGLLAGLRAGWGWLAIYALVMALGPLMVLGRNLYIGGQAVLTNPGHIDHLLGATHWLRSLAIILCVAPPPYYHCYAALVLLPGALLGLASLAWRRWPLEGYPLALGLTLAGLLAPYLVISPYAYEPRQSIHLLPLATLSLALAARRTRLGGGRTR